MTRSDARIAREWAERVAEESDAYSFAQRTAAAHILATTPPPTMADIAWDDDVHTGLCALYAYGDLVLMIGPDLDNEDTIICHYIHYGSPVTVGLLAEKLTPIPGTKINLTPRREPEPESTPEPEQPQPEDVKPDPQPGEAWLIEFEGGYYEAVCWYSPIYAHWAFADSREGLRTIESPEATPVSRLVPERAPSHPTVLTTEKDYAQAPTGTVVADDSGDPWVKDDLGFWLICGEGGSEISRLMALAARRVLRWGETL